MPGIQAHDGTHDEAHPELIETESRVKMRITWKGQVWLSKPPK
jgi:hypothetical protein